MQKQVSSDIELVCQAKCGDSASFGLLFERFRPRLYAMALNILNDVQSADAAVQDTFVVALTKLHALRAPAAFTGWLYTILRNVCRGYQRAAMKQKSVPDVVLESAVEKAADHKSIEESVDRMLVKDDVFRALASLSEPLRVTIMLRYIGSFNSYDDIAMILGVPVGTVRSRLAEARRKLLGHFRQSAGQADASAMIKERQEQYLYALERLYRGERDWFLKRYSEDLQYVLQGELLSRELLVKDTDEDLAAGSVISPFHFMVSGSVTIVEAHIKNSAENPFRCPPMGVELLFHDQDRVVRLHRYMAAHDPAAT